MLVPLSRAPNRTAESRAAAQARVISAHLEHDMELLGLTGVEDRLQDDVRGTLECMRNAGGTLQRTFLLAFALCFYFRFRFVGLASVGVSTDHDHCSIVHVWMLTGDKVETARCIAISTKMVGRGQYIHEVAKGVVLLIYQPLPCAD